MMQYKRKWSEKVLNFYIFFYAFTFLNITLFDAKYKQVLICSVI